MADNSFISSELLKHKFVVVAAAATVVLIVGSGIYFLVATRPPTGMSVATTTTGMGAITASGVIEPVQNPDLSFETGGRVSSVGVSVGDRVYAGETLAALDTATLAASLAAANARLDALTAPPRTTDVAIRQAAVDQATQAVAATYASVSASLQDAYGKTHDAVYTADVLFSSPSSASPTLLFATNNGGAAQTLVTARTTIGADLALWQSELDALPAVPADSDLDIALGVAAAHLGVARTFETDLIAALNGAIPSTSFPQSSITAALATASAARDTVNGLALSVTAMQQSLVSASLAVQSAQNALDQLNAGASVQDIAAAKANVEAVEAQISQNIIVAPFSGTVAAVAVKSGEIASPNTTAITVIPDAALQATVYVTEIDVARLAVGDAADVTLDAYGAGRHFAAVVQSVDQAPSVTNQGGYKVTLSFVTPSVDIKSGMTANATIMQHNQ